MKFTTTSGDLLKALSKANTVVNSKSVIPILDNFLFEVTGTSLVISATNLELSMKVSISVKGNSNGRIAVPSKRILDTVTALPMNVALTFTADVNTKKIVMSTEKGTYHLTGESADDYPEIKDLEKGNEIQLKKELLKRMINKTSFAASTDDHRPAMTGILFELKENELRCVATDGHRLSRMIVKDVSSKKPYSVIIPQKALSVLNRALEEDMCSFGFDETQARFAFGNTNLFTRLIEEKYPNYEAVIPSDNEKHLRINREELHSSVRRVALYSSANTSTQQIRFSLKKNAITLSAEDTEVGCNANEEMECEFSNSAMEIGFNAAYITDILSHLDSDEVIFSFNSPTRAALVKPAQPQANEDCMMLVMPVRLNS